MNVTVARLIAPALLAIAVAATAGERENLARLIAQRLSDLLLDELRRRLELHGSTRAGCADRELDS